MPPTLMPYFFQTRSSCRLEPIRYSMRPVMSWFEMNWLTALAVSPFGSTETATTCTFLASGPSCWSAECRLPTISGQMSGQCE